MPNTKPIVMTSYEEILENKELILEKFKEDTVVVIRGANLTTDQQSRFAKSMGDYVGWFPNNSDDFNQRYTEDHSRVGNKEEAGADAIVVPWHLEHVDFDTYTPIIAGIWNMLHFTADPETGKTYFVDASAIYRSLPEDSQEFLSKCVVEWYEADGSGPFITPAVQSHWLTGEPVIRMDVRFFVSTPEMLHTFNEEDPTLEDRKKFVELRNHFIDEIRFNEDIRIVHKWEQGDLLIVDLFKHAHAVTGGFNSENRKFTGEWVYPKNPETREFLDFIDNIASKRADG
tara:strand:+ start:7288 stop:8145 length:858 start_codon:yes stop_codon:yes gene_type:complete